MRTAAAAFCFATLLSIGCDATKLPEIPNPFVDGPELVQPAQPATPVVYPQPEPWTPNVNPDCPDGTCPYNSTGVEINSSAAPVAYLDGNATSEVKSQCTTCPQNRPTVIRRPSSRVVVPSRSYPIPRLAPGETFLHWGPPHAPRATPELIPTPTPTRIVPSTTRTPQTLTPQTMPAPPRPPMITPRIVDADAGEITREGVFACQHCGKRTVGAEWMELWADDGTPLTCLCKECWNRLTPAQRRYELERYAKATRGMSPIVEQAIAGAIHRSAAVPRSQATPPPVSYGTEFK